MRPQLRTSGWKPRCFPSKSRSRSVVERQKKAALEAASQRPIFELFSNCKRKLKQTFFPARLSHSKFKFTTCTKRTVAIYKYMGKSTIRSIYRTISYSKTYWSKIFNTIKNPTQPGKQNPYDYADPQKPRYVRQY